MPTIAAVVYDLQVARVKTSHAVVDLFQTDGLHARLIRLDHNVAFWVPVRRDVDDEVVDFHLDFI